ncbi:LADA_0A00694g1_1 [Lachancea dasiensis]|uniref:LADA_0A00694g1_1 n=1 Tax=Lachancea dasiensis TaxID=1072105 RepID=A0A1G4ILR9_9SACH|nr:LADA_0A00694g1_1 [Lachancea dasiensis]
MSDPQPFSEVKPSSFDEVLTPGQAKQRKKLACVECRQQKSKCDAHEKAPKPCTRCQKKKIPCVLQKDFRRTYKRVRNEAIEQRFKELTKSLSNLDADEILKKIQEEQQALLDQSNFTKEKVKKLRRANPDSRSDEALTSADDSPSVKTEFHVTPGIPITSTALEEEAASSELLRCAPKSLGDVYMSTEDIAEIYTEFVHRYHPFLPVVDVSKGPERIFNLSPCLFWVIMLVGLRRKFRSTGTMTKLSKLVKSILAEITISPIIRYVPTESDEPVLNVASVYSVQAFLLYTFWPPLTSSLSADTSWNTMGSAMFQAIRVGLNCAEFSKEYVTTNSDHVQEQVRTWICCNVVSQTIASSFGFPAFVSFDHTVISSCRISSRSDSPRGHATVPESIKQMMHIAHFENQLTKTMNSNPVNALGMVGGEQKLPLLHVLEQQLAELEIRLRQGSLDDIRKFLLLVAKVHLLTYCFTGVKPFESTTEGTGFEITVRDAEMNFEVKQGFVKVYNASMELLIHTTSMCDADPKIIKFFPGVFVINIWQTACIISKLSHSSLRPVLNLELGRKVYQQAVTLTLNASVLKYDMAYRSSGIMRSIWSMFGNMHSQWDAQQSHDRLQIGKDFNLDITIKSRMAASVFFDCLYKLREKCGMAKLKREQRSDSDDDGGLGENELGKRDRRLSGTQEAEENARKLIKTIPLDPEPINAPIGNIQPTTSTTEPTDVVSLRNVLNKRLLTPATDSIPSIPNQYGHVDVAQQPLAAGPPVFTPDALIDRNLFDARFITRDGPEVQEATTISSSHRSNSPTPMDHWDNWESDTVWKDVDILMNEFAFNPTV